MINPLIPLVIPIFIAHEGCPHRCLFCNQNPITGTPDRAANIGAAAVVAEIAAWLERSPRRGRRVQVAFYGGSFTGLPEGRQRELLAAVHPFIRQGLVDGIRVSTRPDYVNAETPILLKGYGVETVELGVQSLDQGVLDRALRGHSAAQAEAALRILQGAGFVTGVQIMVGLPGETTVSALAGARRLAALRPDIARIYPALVIRGSGLATLYRQGGYRPLSLARAIALAGRMTTILNQAGIAVIRTGLQPSVELAESLVAGPYHPALGELVKARLLFNEARRQLTPYQGRPCRLIIASRDQSLLTGQGQAGLRRLRALGLLDQSARVITDPEGVRGGVRVEEGISRSPSDRPGAGRGSPQWSAPGARDR